MEICEASDFKLLRLFSGKSMSLAKVENGLGFHEYLSLDEALRTLFGYYLESTKRMYGKALGNGKIVG